MREAPLSRHRRRTGGEEVTRVANPGCAEARAGGTPESLLRDSSGLSRDARCHSLTVSVLGLPWLIEVKARANRAKDRAVLPLLIATLDEQKSRQR